MFNQLFVKLLLAATLSATFVASMPMDSENHVNNIPRDDPLTQFPDDPPNPITTQFIDPSQFTSSFFPGDPTTTNSPTASPTETGGSCKKPPFPVTTDVTIPEPKKGASLPSNVTSSTGSRRAYLGKLATVTLWHGTCKHNNNTIAQNGLQIGGPGDFTYRGAAYLSPDKWSAAGFIVDKPGSDCNDANDYAVLQFEINTDKAEGLVLSTEDEAEQNRIMKYLVPEEFCPRAPEDEDAKEKHDKSDYIWGTIPLADYQRTQFVQDPFRQVAIISQTGLGALTYKRCEQIDPKYINDKDSISGHRITGFKPC